MESKTLSIDMYEKRVNTLIRLRNGKKGMGKGTILFLTKYPPVAGGVATLEYWRAQCLAEAGNKVIVVTNCIEDSNGFAYDDSLCFVPTLKGNEEGEILTIYTSRSYLKNKYVKRSHQHIPYNDMSTTKLYITAKKAIEKYNPDVIYSGYLEPYGCISYLLSEKYGIPYIIGFAGSDFTRLISIPELNNAYSEVLRNATMIMTSWNKAERLIGLGVLPECISCIPQPIILPKHYYAMKNFNRGLTVGIYGKCGKHKKVDSIIKGIGAVSEIQINCMTMPANRDYLVNIIQKHCINNKVRIIEAKHPQKMPDFLNLNQIMFFFEESFDVADHVPIAAIEAGLCGVCVVLSKNLYKSIEDFGFKENYNCIVLNECSSKCVEIVLSDFVQNTTKYIEMGLNASISLGGEINKNIDEYRSVLFNARRYGRVKELEINYWIGFYAFFKYTMLLLGEERLSSMYATFLKCSGKRKYHLLNALYDFASQIVSLDDLSTQMTRIDREIIEMELLRIKLYKNLRENNDKYWDACVFEKHELQTYVKNYISMKKEVESTAYEIFRGRRITEVKQINKKTIFILCKNSFEIKVYDGTDEYANYLHNEFENANNNLISSGFTERAIDEGLIEV